MSENQSWDSKKSQRCKRLFYFLNSIIVSYWVLRNTANHFWQCNEEDTLSILIVKAWDWVTLSLNIPCFLNLSVYDTVPTVFTNIVTLLWTFSISQDVLGNTNFQIKGCTILSMVWTYWNKRNNNCFTFTEDAPS